MQAGNHCLFNASFPQFLLLNFRCYASISEILQPPAHLEMHYEFMIANQSK